MRARSIARSAATALAAATVLGTPSDAAAQALTCADPGTNHSYSEYTTDQTWTAAGSPHHVLDAIRVTAGATLTIEPGALVCVDYTNISARTGGRIVARGTAASPIRFTARDPDPERTWGPIVLEGTPSDTSFFTNVVIEHANSGIWAAALTHPVAIDSALIRQIDNRAVYLIGPGKRLSRSTVDTTLSASAYPAVEIRNGATFEETVIRGSAGPGLRVSSDRTAGVRVLGGRIEGSAGIGIDSEDNYCAPAHIAEGRPVHVTGGATYPLKLFLPELAALYPTAESQEGLLGNARDTIYVAGGCELTGRTFEIGSALPLRVQNRAGLEASDVSLRVGAGSLVTIRPGAHLAFETGADIFFFNGGLLAQGTAADPIHFSWVAGYPGEPWWDGLVLGGTPPDTSRITNAIIENARTGVLSYDGHAVALDSVRIRQSVRDAADLRSPGSRLSRSVIDTTQTVAYNLWAVNLGESTLLEGTVVRGAAVHGVRIGGDDVRLRFCEITGSGESGIYVTAAGLVVSDCNLVDNTEYGLVNRGAGELGKFPIDARWNWWGDVNGPNGWDGDGLDDDEEITDFDPWLTCPVDLADPTRCTTRVAIMPEYVELDGVGATAVLVTQVYEGTTPVPGDIERWESEDPTVATVDGGVVTAVAAGETRVFAHASSAGTAPGFAYVMVYAPEALSCASPGGVTYSTPDANWRIETSATWSKAASPHRVARVVEVVGEAASLTIEAGALVCVDAGGALDVHDGGRLHAVGTEAERIVFTAADESEPWVGLTFAATGDTSRITNATVERSTYGIRAGESTHPVLMEGVVIRRSTVRALHLIGDDMLFSRSTVDTTLTAEEPAVILGNGNAGGRFEESVVRGAAGVGIAVRGNDAVLRRSRIEGSGDTGLEVLGETSRLAAGGETRITGGASYPFRGPVEALQRIAPTQEWQDSLAGNARDTVVVTWESGQDDWLEGAALTWGPRLVMRIDLSVRFTNGARLELLPGATLAFAEDQALRFDGDAWLLARGTPAEPVRFTALFPEQPWYGLVLEGAPADTSRIVNSVLEYAASGITADVGHPLVIDSTHVRQFAWAGVILGEPGSRITRSVVDTVYGGDASGVSLGDGTLLDQTVVRGVMGAGVDVWAAPSAPARITRCEITGNDWVGVHVRDGAAAVVNHCNLVANGGDGVLNDGATIVDARYNWWGDPAGPLGASGDGVSENVDYRPYMPGPVDPEEEPRLIVNTTVAPAALDLAAVGDTARLAASSWDGALTLEGAYTWTSRDAAVAAVDADGLVHAEGPGATWIVAAEGGGTADSARVTVAAPPSLSCASGGGTAHAGTLNLGGNQTWTEAASPHTVTGELLVFDNFTGRTLTIEPGALVCLAPDASISMRGWTRLVARGTPAEPIRFTAADPGAPWYRLHFFSTPRDSSYLTNVVIEHSRYGVDNRSDHKLAVDSARIRQSVSTAVRLNSGYARISRSVIDTTLVATDTAVIISAGSSFEGTTVRGAAGLGVYMVGNAYLLGGRIEGSGGIGLYTSSDLQQAMGPLVITGGASYPARVRLANLAALWPSAAAQDDLLGNARDTLVVAGWLREEATLEVSPRLPWLAESITVGGGGVLEVGPGAAIAFRSNANLWVEEGGRIVAHGSAAQPATFTAGDPAGAWGGIWLEDAPAEPSVFVHALIERSTNGIGTQATHAVFVDSTRIRRTTNTAVTLSAPGSRLSASVVDTTLTPGVAAVVLMAGTALDGTVVRGAAGDAVRVGGADVAVERCAIGGSGGHGVLVDVAGGVGIHDCDLTENGGEGVHNTTTTVVDARSNWWGDAAGPLGPAGDGVSDYVDYEPYLTAPAGGGGVPVIVSTTVAPAELTLAAVGDTARLVASSWDGSATVQGVYAWVSRSLAVAEVDADGLVHGAGVGDTWVIATEQGGTADSARVSVSAAPANLPPIVAISEPSADTTVVAGSSVRFVGTASDADGAIAQVAWDFGDGTALVTTLAAGLHRFEAPGVYRVELRVVDDDGAADAETVTITVVSADNAVPDAVILSPAGDTTVVVGDTIRFSGTGTDADGVVVALAWSFGDGRTAVGAEPGTWAWSEAGEYTVELVATDDRQARSEPARVRVTVTSNARPTLTIATPSADTTVFVGDSVLFSASAADVDGDALTLVWSFTGDAEPPSIEEGDASWFLFRRAGTWAVTVFARDPRGAASDTARLAVVVIGRGPNVDVTSPGSAERVDGHDVVFVIRARRTQDPHGDVDGDGVVDSKDIALVRQAFGRIMPRGAPPGAPRSEP